MAPSPQLAGPLDLPLPPTFPHDAAASWRRARGYAVPRWMIERATERRLAGDWRGACAAAGVDVAVDPVAVRRDLGATVADALDEDLSNLAPDLVRWHLPRILHGRTTIATKQIVVLADYGRTGRSTLYVVLPSMADGPQRLRLVLSRLPVDDSGRLMYADRGEHWGRARYLWDARHAGELRQAYGGSATRAPFLHEDGSPIAVHEYPDDLSPTDPAARTEWITDLFDNGQVVEAFEEAGIELDRTPARPRYGRPIEPVQLLARLPICLPRIAADLRLSSRAAHLVIPLFAWGYVLLEITGGQHPHARLVTPDDRHRRGTTPPWRRLPDLELLRFGRIHIDDLHPLVAAALAPGRPVRGAGQPDAGPVSAGPPDAGPPSPVTVRCRGEWHEVSFAQAELRTPHTGQEHHRELALRAFGGRIAGCFAVRQAWRDGVGRLPRDLRAQRRDLFERIQHGDTVNVLRLLAYGLDPHVRDGRQRTLLHVLHLVDHTVLLPRLLKAGLDLEARDHHQRTPLHIAVGDGGRPALVRALLDAGARIDVVDHQGLSLHDLVRGRHRADLPFLIERLEAL